ncbi:MAG: protein kinase domain-containing protein [Planctomycetota bacterium]|jgi:serine/threonine-protein kinase
MSEELLDGGMRAAYRRKKEGESILATIEALTGATPRILLRDVADDTAPVVKPGGSAEAGTPERYQIVGEIARGGVGVVFKGRDTDLGREVAMKVLREGHSHNPELLQRFVEEAQIGGQLQHPGIVPVYELGLNAHKQPYFTMKLVKGQTLSALLAKRETPAQDRRRFLAIFELVCQTMAYAHARGVVHRDLKPSNVMVGAFGEVQIVDWGFAKVLRHGGVEDERRVREKPDTTIVETVRSGSVGSESQAGSVMGTPAYMPPEQALGNVDRLDERSDVFSLGAILCEILTGKPPYVDPASPLVVQAAEGRQDDARARLDACGADVDLVELAKRCLSPAPAVRPPDAAAVAEAIARHMSDVDERARRADRAAAAARVKAEEERKRRHLVMALAAAVVCAVIASAGGLYWVESEQRRARDLARVPVDNALQEAAVVRGEARGDLARWPQAFAAAGRALRLAQEADADPELKRKAQEFLATMRVERAQAEASATAAARDQRMVARLEEIFTWRGEDFDAHAQESAYEKAFEEYGVEPSGSAIADDLVAALDDWGEYDRASEADPDPWRVKVRTLAADDSDALAKLAEPEDLDELPARSLALLGERLGRAGNVRDARTLFRQAQRKASDDFRILFGLGWWLSQGDAPEANEAGRFFQMALLLRPESVGTRYQLGLASHAAHDILASLGNLREVYKGDPDFAKVRERYCVALSIQGRGYTQAGATPSAVEVFREITRVRPDYAEGHQWLANTLMRLPEAPDHVDELLGALRQAHRLEPDNRQVAGALAQRLFWTKRYEESIELLQRWIAGHQDEPMVTCRLKSIIAKSYRALGQYEEALATLRAMAELVSPRPPDKSWHKLLGETCADAGRWDDAIQSLRTVLRDFDITRIDTGVFDQLAHVYRMKGDHVAARRVGEECRDFLRGMVEKDPDHDGAKYVFARWLTRTPERDLRDPELALKLAQEVFKKLPKNTNARDLLFMARCRAGRHREAIDESSDSVHHGWPNISVTEFRLYLAMSYWQSGQRDDALEVYGRAKRYMETFDTVWQIHAQALYAEAREMIEGG